MDNSSTLTANTVKKQNEKLKDFLASFFSRVPVIIGSIIIILIILMAVLAPLLTPYSPTKQNLLNALAAPSIEHLLGTDALGRDVLTRIIYGSHSSLIVGFFSTIIAGVLGMGIGLLAGYAGKWVDNIVMRIMDAMMSVPVIILALFLSSILGKGLGNIVLCLGIVMIPSYARVTRGQVLSIKQLDYVVAAKISGGKPAAIALKHILPNSLAPNLVLMTMNLGMAILAEASLSFLGMGVNPPTPTWGGMVSEGYRYLATNPLLALTPGFFVMLIVWAFNIVGDALRDALDPRLRGSL